MRAALRYAAGLAVGVAALGVVALLPIFCEELDIVSVHYPSLAEARADGAIERSWLPAFLPPSSRDIAEIHNLDTNERCGRATADPGELSSLAHELARFGFAPFEGALPPPPRFSRVRRCPFIEADTAAVGAAFRRKVTGWAEYEYLVLDWSTGTLFGYSAPR